MLVSIVTPSYNSADTIGRAIESVLNQTYNDIEHIIIDDGSSDHTAEVVNEYESDRLRLIQFDQNKGANAARNEGIRAANGDLISFLDADDMLHAKYIEQVVKEFSKHSSDCAGVATSYTWIGTDDDKLMNYTPDRHLDKDVFIRGNPIGSFSATTFRRIIFDEVGYLDKDLTAAQDYDFYLRVVDAGYMISGLNTVLVTKYDQNDNISSDIEKKRRAFNQLISKHGDLLSSKRLATQHNMLGLLCAETGEIDTANQEFRAAISYDPYRLLYYYHFLSTSFNKTIYYISMDIKQKVNRILYTYKQS